MIRLPVAEAYRLLKGFQVSSVCRFGIRRHADDVTKCTSGYLQVQHREYCRGQFPHANRTQSSAVSFLHLNYLRGDATLKQLNSFSPSAFLGQHLVCIANFATSPDSKDKVGAVKSESRKPAATEVAEEKLSVFKRFKRTYKEHGKILVVVHLATSIMWYGSFYAAVRCGLDIIPWLEHCGLSEVLIKPFRAGGLGDFAIAYLIYKLATPARYTVTLGGTNFAIRHLRSTGKMAPTVKEDSIRELYKEGRQNLKDSTLRQDRLQKLREMREKRKAEKLQKGKH